MRASHPLRARARRNCGYGAADTSGLLSPSDTVNGVGPEMLKTGRIGILDDGGYWYWDGTAIYHAKPERDWLDWVTYAGSEANTVSTNDLEPSTVRIASNKEAFSKYMVANVYPWYMLDSSGKVRDPRPISAFAKPGYYVSKGFAPGSKDGVALLVGNRTGANKYRWDLAHVEIVYPSASGIVFDDASAKDFHNKDYKEYDYLTYEAGDALLASMGTSAPTKPGGGGGGGATGGGGGRKRDDIVKPGTAPKVRDTSRQTVKTAQDTRIRPGAGGNAWILPVGLGLAALGTIVGAVYWRKRKAQ